MVDFLIFTGGMAAGFVLGMLFDGSRIEAKSKAKAREKAFEAVYKARRGLKASDEAGRELLKKVESLID